MTAPKGRRPRPARGPSAAAEAGPEFAPGLALGQLARSLGACVPAVPQRPQRPAPRAPNAASAS